MEKMPRLVSLAMLPLGTALPSPRAPFLATPFFLGGAPPMGPRRVSRGILLFYTKKLNLKVDFVPCVLLPPNLRRCFGDAPGMS